MSAMDTNPLPRRRKARSGQQIIDIESPVVQEEQALEQAPEDPAEDELDDAEDDEQWDEDAEVEETSAEDSEEAGPSTANSEELRRRRIARSGGTTASLSNRQRAKANGTPRLTRSGAPKRILAQQKRRDAIELRKMGVTYQKIADAVGYPSSQEARKQVLKAYNEIVQEPAMELRGLQVERLNHLLTIAWQQAQGGSLSAINVCVSLMSRIDILMGTESAQKIEVVSVNSAAPDVPANSVARSRPKAACCSDDSITCPGSTSNPGRSKPPVMPTSPKVRSPSSVTPTRRSAQPAAPSSFAVRTN